jgi:hypothetical protein
MSRTKSIVGQLRDRHGDDFMNDLVRELLRQGYGQGEMVYRVIRRYWEKPRRYSPRWQGAHDCRSEKALETTIKNLKQKSADSPNQLLTMTHHRSYVVNFPEEFHCFHEGNEIDCTKEEAENNAWRVAFYEKKRK